MKKLLLASAAVAALASGAHAADLGVQRVAVDAAIVAPVFNWTGFYLGAHIGYGWANSNWSATGLPIGVNPKGVFGGLQAGYNWQINSLVLGLEADLSAAGLNNAVPCPNPTFTCSGRSNFLSTVRGRAGIAVDRALLYVTGGLAIGNWNHRAANAAGSTVGGHASSVTRAGLALGAGLEYAFTPNVTAKLEYMYYHFSNYSALNDGGGTSSTFAPRAHTVKLGINYLFTTGPSAVVARY